VWLGLVLNVEPRALLVLKTDESWRFPSLFAAWFLFAL
jgi:hypothetical protein